MFEVPRIRTLLYSDAGLIQGDTCPACNQLDEQDIQLQLREQAVLLIEQPEGNRAFMPSSPDQVLELLECSEEKLQFPTGYQWLLKRLELLKLSCSATRVAWHDH